MLFSRFGKRTQLFGNYLSVFAVFRINGEADYIIIDVIYHSKRNISEMVWVMFGSYKLFGIFAEHSCFPKQPDKEPESNSSLAFFVASGWYELFFTGIKLKAVVISCH